MSTPLQFLGRVSPSGTHSTLQAPIQMIRTITEIIFPSASTSSPSGLDPKDLHQLLSGRKESQEVNPTKGSLLTTKNQTPTFTVLTHPIVQATGLSSIFSLLTGCLHTAFPPFEQALSSIGSTHSSSSGSLLSWFGTGLGILLGSGLISSSFSSNPTKPTISTVEKEENETIRIINFGQLKKLKGKEFEKGLVHLVRGTSEMTLSRNLQEITSGNTWNSLHALADVRLFSGIEALQTKVQSGRHSITLGNYLWSNISLLKQKMLIRQWKKMLVHAGYDSIEETVKAAILFKITEPNLFRQFIREQAQKETSIQRLKSFSTPLLEQITHYWISHQKNGDNLLISLIDLLKKRSQNGETINLSETFGTLYRKVNFTSLKKFAFETFIHQFKPYHLADEVLPGILNGAKQGREGIQQSIQILGELLKSQPIEKRNPILQWFSSQIEIKQNHLSQDEFNLQEIFLLELRKAAGLDPIGDPILISTFNNPSLEWKDILLSIDRFNDILKKVSESPLHNDGQEEQILEYSKKMLRIILNRYISQNQKENLDPTLRLAIYSRLLSPFQEYWLALHPIRQARVLKSWVKDLQDPLTSREKGKEILYLIKSFDIGRSTAFKFDLFLKAESEKSSDQLSKNSFLFLETVLDFSVQKGMSLEKLKEAFQKKSARGEKIDWSSLGEWAESAERIEAYRFLFDLSQSVLSEKENPSLFLHLLPFRDLSSPNFENIDIWMDAFSEAFAHPSKKVILLDIASKFREKTAHLSKQEGWKFTLSTFDYILSGISKRNIDQTLIKEIIENQAVSQEKIEEFENNPNFYLSLYLRMARSTSIEPNSFRLFLQLIFSLSNNRIKELNSWVLENPDFDFRQLIGDPRQLGAETKRSKPAQYRKIEKKIIGWSENINQFGILLSIELNKIKKISKSYYDWIRFTGEIDRISPSVVPLHLQRAIFIEQQPDSLKTLLKNMRKILEENSSSASREYATLLMNHFDSFLSAIQKTTHVISIADQLLQEKSPFQSWVSPIEFRRWLEDSTLLAQKALDFDILPAQVSKNIENPVNFSKFTAEMPELEEIRRKMITPSLELFGLSESDLKKLPEDKRYEQILRARSAQEKKEVEKAHRQLILLFFFKEVKENIIPISFELGQLFYSRLQSIDEAHLRQVITIKIAQNMGLIEKPESTQTQERKHKRDSFEQREEDFLNSRTQTGTVLYDLTLRDDADPKNKHRVRIPGRKPYQLGPLYESDDYDNN